MPSYTRQEAFDRAYLGLRSQGFDQATGTPQGCVLLDSKGNRCAVGHLLEKPSLNQGFTADSVALTQHDTHFYDSLVRAHDYGTTPTEMEQMLRQVAAEFNLEVPQ